MKGAGEWHRGKVISQDVSVASVVTNHEMVQVDQSKVRFDHEACMMSHCQSLFRNRSSGVNSSRPFLQEPLKRRRQWHLQLRCSTATRAGFQWSASLGYVPVPVMRAEYVLGPACR